MYSGKSSKSAHVHVYSNWKYCLSARVIHELDIVCLFDCLFVCLFVCLIV